MSKNEHLLVTQGHVRQRTIYRVWINFKLNRTLTRLARNIGAEIDVEVSRRVEHATEKLRAPSPGGEAAGLPAGGDL